MHSQVAAIPVEAARPAAHPGAQVARVAAFPALVGAFLPALWLGISFLAISAITRLALLIATGDGISIDIASYAYVFTVGLGYDLLAFAYFGLPLAVLLWLTPARGLERRRWRAAIATLSFLLLFVALFVAIAEWTFWEEFQTRFNFIAVDYLVYTTEVIGNIRESYPIGWILSGLTLGSLAVFIGTRRWRLPRMNHPTSFAQRSAVLAVWIGFAALGIAFVSASLKDTRSNQYVNELAGNGIYQFFAAYRMASLDYDRFYSNLPLDKAFQVVRQELASPDARFLSTDPTDIRRQITNAATEKKLNVVLISVESLSASYSGTFGRTPSQTPRLDTLTADSLLFTRLFASGTRTVRGLEALALSVPPTPGESIVKRPGNEDLFSLARVFNSKGYESKFLYGGFGAFDNMNYFFSHNGYQVRDRSDIAKEDIHFANIWGVADEDLYSLALRELDASHASGKPVFAHVMTTSNHRPYTFPEGRGPWPQGLRESAVRYTDWAIVDFIERARSKPWFAETVFVLTSDHCGSSAGKAQLPTFRYHIPMWIYAPAHIAPGRFDRMLSQIDIAPTILGLLGMDYESEFYGRDVFREPPGDERAFIGTYQLLGYLRPQSLVQLSPGRRAGAVVPAFVYDTPQPSTTLDPASKREAIAWYQTASHRFQHGLMRRIPAIEAVAGLP
jgi:phosphoglycerol transferase MdoB-like AlkP superfamily enzyme